MRTDTELLDFLESLGNEDYPRFVAGVSKVGQGMYLRSCRHDLEAGTVREAIERLMNKLQNAKPVLRA